MEKNPQKIKDVISGTGKAASALLGKAKQSIVHTIDQNNDGKLDMKDLSDASAQWKEKRDQMKQEADKKALCPIFEDDLDSADFSLSKLIRVAEIDKKHAESIVCQDSIGFESKQKDLRIVTIYPDKASAFGLTFYPDSESELYYVDPSDRDHYIALDEYFNYLKVARVSELQKIAQDLGAKHFRVTYKEQKKSFEANAAKAILGAKAQGKQSGNAEYSHDAQSSAFSKIEIAAEMECIGHKPVEPKLLYFKKDPQILNLVALRLSDNPLTHQVYTLALSNSTGIKVKDAIKIDAALASMKCIGNATVTSEAQSESRRFFEYEIDF